MTPSVHICDDLEELNRRALKLFLDHTTGEGTKTVVLSGGRTPEGFYRLLARRSGVDWQGIHLFMGDERWVAPDHPHSNYRMIRESLLSGIPLPEENFHRIETALPPHECAERYEKEVKEFFGGKPLFDLVYLGMGSDGHVLSIFPGDRAIYEKKRIAVAVSTDFHPSGWRITLTLPVVNMAQCVVFMVAGREKAETVKKVIEEPSGSLPAELVRPERGKLVWLLDREAGSLL